MNSPRGCGEASELHLRESGLAVAGAAGQMGEEEGAHA